LVNLITLDLRNNYIKSTVGLGGLVKLEKLNINGNQLEDIIPRGERRDYWMDGIDPSTLGTTAVLQKLVNLNKLGVLELKLEISKNYPQQWITPSTRIPNQSSSSEESGGSSSEESGSSSSEESGEDISDIDQYQSSSSEESGEDISDIDEYA